MFKLFSASARGVSRSLCLARALRSTAPLRAYAQPRLPSSLSMAVTHHTHYAQRYAATQRSTMASEAVGGKEEGRMEEAELRQRFPHHIAAYEPTHTVREFRDAYEDRLTAGEALEEEAVTLCGRVSLRREASKKLLFLVLQQGDDTVQVMCSARAYGEVEHAGDLQFGDVLEWVRRGDVVGVRGFAKKSNKGELSICPRSMRLLAPCALPVPHYHGLKDPEIRYRKRYLDLIANREVAEAFRVRSTVTSTIRRFLEAESFLEVETPILWAEAGGATARPFVTQHTEQGGGAFGSRALQMRIAPELFLKQLVVGGMDRVYDMGKVFRNEGADATHNPEFTICEFYQAHADCSSFMDLMERLVREVAERATGRAVLVVDGTEVDLSKPFPRIDIMSGLEEAAGHEMPDPNDPDAADEWRAVCERHGVRCPPPFTTARAVDKMIGKFLEPQCVGPTFLTNHPLLLSPLAKEHRDKPGFAERFELFVGGVEVSNGYSELNDPEVQRQRFRVQAAARAGGDAECHGMNEDFVEALQYGLPPTAGCGIGVDRLVQVVLGAKSIRDVILFPLMRPRTQADADTAAAEKQE